ncbi:MAG: ArsR family transcriptional regulator [Methanosarcina sp.]|jgi:predicted transcriptional regulator|nr:ArsR family transcriptional regulator [Methanosarcina sp.]MDD3316009.1 ArsR family transcriptional regulator [Methanosarcina sp.]MDD4305819.1 ArsR family transcriptional regulator [Methanosarcina sp.]NLN43170.1 ArsR family transcriptional regulator [Methanosarcina sp.]
MVQQIILRHLEKPQIKSLEEDLLWLCDSFGFSSGRDTENTATRIVFSLLDKISNDEIASSEALAENLDIKTSRVNHHLRNLNNSGLLYRKKRLIYLRGGSLKAAVKEMRKDSERIFDELESIAEEIDSRIGIKNR